MFSRNDDKYLKLSFDGAVAVIRMCNNENRFNFQSIAAWNRTLDKVLENANAQALVTTGDSKFYSNGVDLDLVVEMTPKQYQDFWRSLEQLFRRIITFPLPTVAAINGHAFAGGAFLVMCHDYRIMNKARGWFCVNEVHLRLPIPTLFLEILKAKIAPGVVLSDITCYGKRFTADDAVSGNFVQRGVSPDSLLDVAMETARELASMSLDRDSLRVIKAGLYSSVVNCVSDVATPKKSNL